MISIEPQLRFVIVTTLVASLLTVAVVSSLFAPGASFVLARDLGWSVFAFVVTWITTAVLGVIVALPAVMLMQRHEVERRLEVVAGCGLLLGALCAYAIQLSAGGPLSEGRFPLLGASAGLLAGLSWWLLSKPKQARD